MRKILNSESQLISKRKFCIRKNYYLRQLRISWYLKRYHDIEVSQVGVWQVLKRNGLNKLPQNQRKRSMEQFKRYEKQVPGHRVQVDKFLSFRNQDGREIKRYQYTAIDHFNSHIFFIRSVQHSCLIYLMHLFTFTANTFYVA